MTLNVRNIVHICDPEYSKDCTHLMILNIRNIIAHI